MGANVKGAVKRVIFPMLYRLRVYDRIFKKIHHNKVIILSGHRVSSDEPAKSNDVPLSFEVGVSAHNFERLIRFLCHEMHVISLKELIDFTLGKGTVPDRAVAVMLDDGYMDNYLNAYPILKRYQVPATIFLATGNINTESLFWWDRIGELIKRTRVTSLCTAEIKQIMGQQLDSVPDTLRLGTFRRRNRAWGVLTRGLRPCHPELVARAIEVLEKQSGVKSDAHRDLHLALTWEQVEEMSRNGIDFGAHTVSHPFLPQLSPDHLTAEVLGSKREIEGHIGKPVTAFAYPYGEFPTGAFDVKRMLHNNGFQCAFMFEDGYVSRGSDPFQLKRLGIGNVSVGMMVRELSALLTESDG